MFRQFETWSQLVEFMHDPSAVDLRKDAILRPILRDHASQHDERWTTILLVMFWPGLTSLLFQKKKWDRDPNELWHILTWKFVEAASRVDVSRRPDRLPQKLINDTASLTYREYCRRWRFDNTTKSIESDEQFSIEAEQGVDLAGIENRQLPPAAEQKLRGWLADGRLTQLDFLLIVGTRIYGKPLRDVASEADITYEAAKKRRQRAEATVRRLGAKKS